MKIKGTAFWTFHNKPNDMSGAFQMDLGLLSKSAVDELQAAGLKVKQERKYEKGDPNYRGTYIGLKSQTVKPEVVDAKTNPWPENVLIGNGSKVIADVGTYEWTFPKTPKPGQKQKHGVSAGFNALQVLELVPFGDPNAPKKPRKSRFEPTEGYDVTDSDVDTTEDDEVPFEYSDDDTIED